MIIVTNKKEWIIDIYNYIDEFQNNFTGKQRVHIVWFYLYEIQKCKHVYNDRTLISGFLGLEGGGKRQEGEIQRGIRNLLGIMNILIMLFMMMISQVCTVDDCILVGTRPDQPQIWLVQVLAVIQAHG